MTSASTMLFALGLVAPTGESIAPAPAPEPAPAPAPAPAEVPADPPSEPPAVVTEPTTDETSAPDEPSTAVVTVDAEPLPAAPARVDPATLDRHAWRGRGFFQIHIGAMVPLGGVRPGFGSVVTAGGGLQVGWRAHPVFAIGVGLTTFVHDAATTLATDSTGATVEVRDFGRLTLFDPVFLRLFVPTKRKIEPRFDVGPLLGTYRAPFSDHAQLAAGARVGAGLDVWIGPSFSLDFGVDPRLIVIEGKAGVSLQAGAGATVHW